MSVPSTRRYNRKMPEVPGPSDATRSVLSGSSLARHNRKMPEVPRSNLVQAALFDEDAPDSSAVTPLQFMQQKSALAEKCEKAILPCVGVKSIIKQVEVADSKLPKNPAPEFVVPTTVERVLLL